MFDGCLSVLVGVPGAALDTRICLQVVRLGSVPAEHQLENREGRKGLGVLMSSVPRQTLQRAAQGMSQDWPTRGARTEVFIHKISSLLDGRLVP